VTTDASTFLPELFERIPAPIAALYDPRAPWALLGTPLDEWFAGLASRIDIGLSPDVRILGDGIVIGKGTRIAAHVVLEGPIWIGEDVEIRPGAYLRGGCFIGDGSVVGANVEMKRAVLFDDAHVPHLNYVGDSILGAHVNLGAGTILSNFRHDGGEVKIPLPASAGGGAISTGRRKFSGILGDSVMTGCNAVVHPGVIVGRESHIYPGLQLRAGIYPARSVLKLRQEIEVVPRR
jgi:NDP-sugar pyrophosphorylase family protein